MSLPALLLALCLASYWRFLRGDRVFGAPARYRRWIVRATLLLAAPALLALAVLGRPSAVAKMPAEFAAVAGPGGPFLLDAALGGIGVGIGLVLLTRPANARTRSHAELWNAMAVSLTAGVTEELFFRLALPLLIALLSGSAVLGFSAAAVLFGLAHRYQGWAGVAATTLTGLMLTAVYLGKGDLWAAMLVHIGINLAGLVLRPARGKHALTRPGA